MTQTLLDRNEIGRRGEEEYARRIGPIVETPENIGRIVAIDLASDDFEVADDPLIAAKSLHSRHTDADVYLKRIGYDAVYAIGASLLTRTPSPEVV